MFRCEVAAQVRLQTNKIKYSALLKSVSFRPKLAERQMTVQASEIAERAGSLISGFTSVSRIATRVRDGGSMCQIDGKKSVSTFRKRFQRADVVSSLAAI